MVRSPRQPDAGIVNVYRQDIVYLQPAVRTSDYMPMGNGDVGMQVDPFGSQGLGGWITKTDIWLETHTNRKDPLASFASPKEWGEAKARGAEGEIFKREESAADHYPQQNVRPRVAARVSCQLLVDGQLLSDTKEVARDYGQVLSLYDAVCGTAFTWPGRSRTRAEAFVASGKNVAVMHFADEGLGGKRVSRRIALQRYRWEAGPYSKGYEGRENFSIVGDAEHQAILLEYSNVGGLRFTAACTVVGSGVRLVIEPNKPVDQPTFRWATWSQPPGRESYPMIEGNAVFEVDAANRLDATVLVAVVTSNEAAEPTAAALALLEQARKETFVQMLGEHETWWHQFWTKSFVELEDPDIESYWYAQNYLVASSSRGKYPPPLCMLWQQFADWPWQGNYFDFNHAALYSAVQITNHPELGEPYWRLIKDAMPGFRANAQRLFDARGIYMPHCYGHDGYETSPPYWRFQYYHTALVGILQYWRYLYSMDTKLLQDEVYPFLKDAAMMYEDLLVWDGQRFNLPVPCCGLNEAGDNSSWNVRNDALDIASVKRLLICAIEAADTLQVDAADRTRWSNVLARLAPLPTDGSIFLINAGGAKSGLVHTNLMVIFPTQAADRSDPRSLATVLTPDEHGMGGQCFTGQMWAASAAWLGRSDVLTRALHAEFQRHGFPNGLIGENVVEFIPEYGREQAFILVGESGPWSQAAISEGLCQSLYDGVIHVFAAPPLNADGKAGAARFAGLRAVGAFLVSSERVPGEDGSQQVRFILVKSLAGAVCKVALPAGWDGATVERVATDNQTLEVVSVAVSKGVVSFATAPDETYLLYPTGSRPDYMWSQMWSQRQPRERRYIGLPVRAAEGKKP